MVLAATAPYAVAALLMAFARVYSAAHYPHEVLSGLAMSTAVVLLGWQLRATPLRPLWVVDRRAPGEGSGDPGHRRRRVPA
jgi:membrane-associated phospholipid phosphatase